MSNWAEWYMEQQPRIEASKARLRMEVNKAWQRESLGDRPVAAPDFITVGQASAAELHGVPWPVDGDATTRLCEYPERRVK